LDGPPVSDFENSLRARQIDCVECETDNDGDRTEEQQVGGEEEGRPWFTVFAFVVNQLDSNLGMTDSR
jgi:hypothetical protein